MIRRFLCAGIALAVVLAATDARAQFDSLASHVPETANALVLLNAEKILESPAAKSGNWKTKIQEAHRSGLTLIPADAKQAVLASEFDLELMAPLWQAGLGTWKSMPDSKTIAERTGGALDTIGNLAAVRLPGDAYVVRFGGGVTGFMTPANRQAVGRWVAQTRDQEKPNLSKYLMESYAFANERGTPVIMALDLENTVTEAGVRAKLEERWKEAGLEGKADVAAVAKVLASIRGATLGVTFKNEPFGALKIDFHDDVKPLAGIAKDLLLHVLHERGAFINEFEDWEVKAEGKQVLLEGHFTDSGLRRVFSVFDRPPALAGPSGEDKSNLSAEEKAKRASLSYFHAVEELLKDLKRKPKNQGSTYTSGSIAQWCANYARKIDNLPVLNVDPYLLEYGAGTANTLRQASAAIKSGGVEGASAARSTPYATNTYTNTNTYGYSYRWGLYGSGVVPWQDTTTTTVVDVRETAAQRARIKGEYRNRSIASARTLLDGIDAQTADVRRQMTQKYQVEF